MTNDNAPDKDLVTRICGIIDKSGLPTEESRDVLRIVEGALDLKKLCERMRSIYLGLPMQHKGLFLRVLDDYSNLAESGRLFALVDVPSYFPEGFVLPGDELRRLREAKHLSQRDLARTLGLNPDSAGSLISRYENGNRELTFTSCNRANLALLVWAMRQYSEEEIQRGADDNTNPCTLLYREEYRKEPVSHEPAFSGSELRKLRLAAGLTLENFARELGSLNPLSDRNILSRYEHGRRSLRAETKSHIGKAILKWAKERSYNPYDL